MGDHIDKREIGAPAGLAGAMVMLLTGEQKATTESVRINIIRFSEFGKYANEVNKD